MIKTKVQFFKNGDKEIASELTEKEDSLGIFEVEYDPSYQDVVYSKKKAVVIDISEKVETESEKSERKMTEFLSSTDISEFDWEGIVVSPDDYSRLIILRDFEGDNGAQQAMLAKTDMKHLAMFKSLGVPVATLKAVYADEIAKLTEISKTRVAIGLNPFDLSFLDE